MSEYNFYIKIIYNKTKILYIFVAKRKPTAWWRLAFLKKLNVLHLNIVKMSYKTTNFFSNGQDLLLFDTDEFVKRPSPDQSEFADLLLPHIPAIKQAVYETASELQCLCQQYSPHYFTPALSAHLFNGLVIGKLKDIMGHERFGETTEGQRAYMKLGKYIVLIKKINVNFEPSNIPTVNVQRISSQYATSTEDPKAIVYLGYRGHGNDLGNIEGIYAIYIDKEQSEKWVIDLDILQRTSQNHTMIFDINETNNTEQRVKVRKVLAEIM